MLNFLRSLFPDTGFVRLSYHKVRGIVAAVINGFPARKMTVIGITGTNGKTTTVNFVTDILVNAGKKVGMTSTIAFRIGDKTWVNDKKMTSLSPFILQKHLKKMLKAGCEYAVVEVSSHAITQSRVWGIDFDIAAFTNVTPEHIEYHGSFDAYLGEKAKLFKMLTKSRQKSFVDKALIINNDDDSRDYFDQFDLDRKFYYGIKKPATISALDINEHIRGIDFTIKIPNDELQIKLNLPGRFNVYNALAATSICLALKIDPRKIEEGLNKVKGVKGRLERVPLNQDYDVIVDYAHTPESLEFLFEMYKRVSENRLIALFGATGGGRDKSKRPKMGAIAHEYADVIILTTDDPYEEDEWEIISHVARGIPRKEGKNFYKLADRREAIKLALMMAEKGDVIVLAGKGADATIMLADGPHKWNDTDVVLDLAKRELNIEL